MEMGWTRTAMNVQWSIRACSRLASSVVYTSSRLLVGSRRWTSSEPRLEEVAANGEHPRPMVQRMNKKIDSTKVQPSEPRDDQKAKQANNVCEAHHTVCSSQNLDRTSDQKTEHAIEHTPTQTPAPRRKTAKKRDATSRAAAARHTKLYNDQEPDWTKPYRQPSQKAQPYYLYEDPTWEKSIFEGTTNELHKAQPEATNEATIESCKVNVIEADPGLYDHHLAWNQAKNFRALGNDWSDTEGFCSLRRNVATARRMEPPDWEMSNTVLGPWNSTPRKVAAARQTNLSDREESNHVPNMQKINPKTPPDRGAKIASILNTVVKAVQDVELIWRSPKLSFWRKVELSVLRIKIALTTIVGSIGLWEYVQMKMAQDHNVSEEQERLDVVKESIGQPDEVSSTSYHSIRPSWLETLGVAIAGGIAAAMVGTMSFLVIHWYGPS